MTSSSDSPSPVRMGRSGDVTVVGGRPPAPRGNDVSQLSVGIERLIVAAALNPAFKRRLLEDRLGAAEASGITLSPTEQKLLQVIPTRDLEVSISRAVIPPTSRRGFIKAVAASIVALVAGPSVIACFGCTGAEPDYPDARYDTTGDFWMDLGGLDAYVRIPSGYSSAVPAPTIVTFHADGETCLSMVQKWSYEAEERGAILVGINDPEAGKAEIEAVMAEVWSDLTGQYTVDASAAYLSGFMEGADLAMKLALTGAAGVQWRGVASFSANHPLDLDDWDTVAHKPAIYLSVGTDDLDDQAANEDRDKLMNADYPVTLAEVPGAKVLTAHSPADAYAWLSTQ